MYAPVALWLLFFSAAGNAVSRAVSLSWETEYSRLEYEIVREKGASPWYSLPKVKDNVADPQALVYTTDNTPVDIAFRRTEALLENLEEMPDAPDLSAERNELEQLKEKLSNPSDPKEECPQLPTP